MTSLAAGGKFKDKKTKQKAADFVRSYMLGFAVADAVALLRVEDLFVDSSAVGCTSAHADRPSATEAWRLAAASAARRG